MHSYAVVYALLTMAVAAGYKVEWDDGSGLREPVTYPLAEMASPVAVWVWKDWHKPLVLYTEKGNNGLWLIEQ